MRIENNLPPISEKHEHWTADTSRADKTLTKNMCLRSKYHNKKGLNANLYYPDD